MVDAGFADSGSGVGDGSVPDSGSIQPDTGVVGDSGSSLSDASVVDSGTESADASVGDSGRLFPDAAGQPSTTGPDSSADSGTSPSDASVFAEGQGAPDGSVVVDASSEASQVADSSMVDGGPIEPPNEGGGCSCSVVGRGESSPWLPATEGGLALVGLLSFRLRRRRVGSGEDSRTRGHGVSDAGNI
jgi:MYXO-CTERM domain-containing protein